MSENLDERYVGIVLDPIRVCARYRPQMGHGRQGGFSLAEFQQLYRKDTFYGWFGLDNPLVYTAHKAAGGMTSVYRQIGIGCEALFRQILRDQLGLSDSDVDWSYTISTSDDRTRRLSLDARVPLEGVRDRAVRRRVLAWLTKAAKRLDIDSQVSSTLRGAVFEVRQGYKSKDSKRQNADIANAATAYTKAYLPCVVVLSTQIDDDICNRYRMERWLVLTGITSSASELESTYAFMHKVIGFDLAGFFERNKEVFRSEVDSVLRLLLCPE